MNPTIDLSPFQNKSPIYRETLDLISRNKFMSDSERDKWIGLLLSLPDEKIVHKIHDYFLNENSAVTHYEEKTLEQAKTISPEEFQKQRKRQAQRSQSSSLSAEKISVGFDQIDLQALEREVEMI